MELHERIKYFRMKAKLSQRNIAETCHVSRATVSNWESGRRTPDYTTLVVLAKHLNITVYLLLGGDPLCECSAEQSIQSTNIINENNKTVFIVPILNTALLLLIIISMLVVFLPTLKEKYDRKNDALLTYENIENVKLELIDGKSTLDEFYLERSVFYKYYYIKNLNVDYFYGKGLSYQNTFYMSICVEMKNKISHNIFQERRFVICNESQITFDKNSVYPYFINSGTYDITVYFNDNIGYIDVTLST